MAASKADGESESGLSSGQIDELRAELAEGRNPTVWFTDAAVGVPKGRSGKVFAMDEVTEGDFIQVRPASSSDTLSFSAAEVSLAKPTRRRKGESASHKDGHVDKSVSGTAKRTGSKSTRRSTSSQSTPSSGSNNDATSKRSPATTHGSSAPKRKPADVAVTLVGSVSGEWSVEVTTGKKRTLRPKRITAQAVAKAARELHPDVEAAVEPLLQAVRDQHRARVEQLQSELSEAQRRLAELGE